MPYKDRATYLRKQREFYARRKARARSSGVNRVTPLTPPISKTRIQTPVTPVFEAGTHPTLATLKRGGSANPTNPKTPKPPKTAVQLATPFPSGFLHSSVCPYCHSSGYSSPGTRCSYCRDGARRSR
jgi:hypothetical protein